ncbi:uncharacterized protein YeaO (DUF488 family) [Pullulanibacillus pueri]|uniref:DUF488 domain-containing protein n=1 Tax=Pullulanibacillus pueri TaxID=1437324 RepID=A0A8J3EP55_9BACL|nr:DUF488 family protein [Pullulanibacillus pueri]MBM7683892.1 uncharacterized protein YeaO (DUF488 family) [Pullulanibacillus pueri]GGH87859.1 hypothetical protein GCM10007096_38850 [Pullulanibacillus pueri]
MNPIVLKRIYEPYDESDGYRILIDRLWPRGHSKTDARLSAWLKEIAPSPELRKWFNHQPERFEVFRERYLHELRTHDAQLQAIDKIIDWVEKGPVTLLYGAKDPTFNHANVLMEEIKLRLNHSDCTH